MSDAFPYALAADGSLVSAPHARRGRYTCLVCYRRMFLKQGLVRAPHFAHYSGHNCDPESVIHEAAKWRLKDALEKGELRSVQVPCSARRNGCEGQAPLFLALAGGEVRLEHGYQHRRFDVAVVSGAHVVLGLELFHSHRVDETKAGVIAGVPWFELGATAVLEDVGEWRALRSSLSACCPSCLAAIQAEGSSPSREPPYALGKAGVVPAAQTEPGETYACPACRAALRRIGTTPPRLFHPGPPCDAHAVLVAAALVRLGALLGASIGAGGVTFFKRFPCAGPVTDGAGVGCAHEVELPITCAYDAYKVLRDGVVLRREGRPVLHLTFGARLEGVKSFALDPAATVQEPRVWPAKGPGGVRCAACGGVSL